MVKINMENIEEGNRIIAEFMGARLNWNDSINEFQNGGIAYSNMQGKVTNYIGGLEYHSSWGWLMHVVEKINSLGYGYEISENHCWFYSSKNKDENIEIANQEQDTTMEAVWKAVIEFIKWYNSTKTKS